MYQATLGKTTFSCSFGPDNKCTIDVQKPGHEIQRYAAISKNQWKTAAWAIAKAWSISPQSVLSPVFSHGERVMIVSLIVDSVEYVGETPFFEEGAQFKALLDAFSKIRPIA